MLTFIALGYQEHGGTEKFIRNFAQYLHQKGFKVRILLLTSKNYVDKTTGIQEYAEVKVLKIHSLPQLFVHRRVFRDFFDDGEETVITFHNIGNIASLLIPYRKNKIVINTRRREPYKGKHFAKQLILDIASHRADAIFGNSPHLVPSNKKLNAKYFWFTNGVDQIKFRKHKTVSEKKSFRIITISNLRREKNLNLLLEVASRLGSSFEFILVGEGEMRPILEKSIIKLNLNVKLLGERSDIVELLSNSDIYFHASNSEGFSNAVLEAMSLGLPVVAPLIPSIEFAVDNTSTLFHTNDIEEASKIILNLKNDRFAITKLGRANRKRVESRFIEKNIFEEIVERIKALKNN